MKKCRILIFLVGLFCVGCGTICNVEARPPKYFGGFLNSVTLRHYNGSCKSFNVRGGGIANAAILPLLIIDPPLSLVADIFTLPAIPFWRANYYKEEQQKKRSKSIQDKIARAPVETETKQDDTDSEKTARNKQESITVSPQKLRELAKNSNEDIRISVAQNPNTPADVLSELATSNLLDIKVAVAKNSNTPAFTLEKLTRDRNKKVKYAIAKNKNASQKALLLLTNEYYTDIKISISRHPNVSEEILQKLAKDSDESVQKAALEILKKPK